MLPRFVPDTEPTSIKVDPLRFNPALVPLRVPPEFKKLMVLANVAIENARVSNVNKKMRFMLLPSYPCH
jgi:hypothetical protein